jgi:hypothetical protein
MIFGCCKSKGRVKRSVSMDYEMFKSLQTRFPYGWC